MAFPLTFCDEDGVLHRYRWEGYPVRTLSVVPGGLESEWTVSGLMGPPTTVPLFHTFIYCGPPAPLPKPPTADEFLDGLARWLKGTEEGEPTWPFL